MNPAPIILFAYNRPQHLMKAIASLQTNKEAMQSTLYVFCDGPRTPLDKEKIKRIGHHMSSVKGFKNIIFKQRTKNAGLAQSVIEGVTEVLNQHPSCIVLEDDLVVSPWFLQFMNQGLQAYHQSQKIFSVSGYCPPLSIPETYPHEAFLFPRINSWGWATWANRWHNIDWNISTFESFIRDKKAVKRLAGQGKDLPVMLLKQQTGKINSWAVRFNQNCFLAEQTNVYPIKSLVKNSGADGTGTHMRASKKYQVTLSSHPLAPQPAEEEPSISQSFQNFYCPSLFRRTINWFKIKHYLRAKN